MDDSRELRTLRDRQEQTRRALDRIGYRSPGVAPMLVQVFNNGAIPTATKKYFAAHPVDPGGAEGEGNVPTFSPEEGTVFVLVVGERVPGAGDYLLAEPIGGRWLADSGKGSSPCVSGRICVTVQSTGCSFDLVGVEVTVADNDGNVISTGATTGSPGKYCVDLPTAGTYHVTSHVPGATDKTATVNATCGIDNNVTLTYPPGTLRRLSGSYLYCDGSTTGFAGLPYAGVILSITATGSDTATATSGADGQAFVVVGTGAWTGSATFPQGRVLEIAGDPATACTTQTSGNFKVFTQQRFSASAFPGDIPDQSSCDATITVRDHEGTTCGTGTLPLRPTGPYPDGSSGEVTITLSPELWKETTENHLDAVWPSSATEIDSPFLPICNSAVIVGAYNFPFPCADPP